MSIIFFAKRDPSTPDPLTQIQKIHPDLREDLRAASGNFDTSSALETIIRSRRPVLPIRYGDVSVADIDVADAEFWYLRVKSSIETLRHAIRAVGRIQVRNHPSLTWVGTGWLVADSIVVTARHVADVFARRTDEGYVFESTDEGDVIPSIDFLQETQNPLSRELRIVEVLHIEEMPGPDLAFLRVEHAGDLVPIPLCKGTAEPHAFVAVIGYYARDSRIPDQALMEDLFGKAWEKKQLSPGTVMAVSNSSIDHDCSTVGGGGGAPLVDLNTGEAVGLNVAGQYMMANHAVPASVIADRLHGIRSRGGPGALPPARLELGQSSQYAGDDQWNWAVWVEASPEQLDAVELVEYTLHPTFPKPVRVVRDRSSKFRLDASGWGTFVLHANVTRRDGSVIRTSLTLELNYPEGGEAVPQR